MQPGVFSRVMRVLDRSQTTSRSSLLWGCADIPGYSHLERISPLLWVGNEVAAAHGDFDAVVSTTTPYDLEGLPAPHLATHQVLFEDGRGAETSCAADFAKHCILQGASVVAESIAAGKKTLVHCAWGQNRSCAICCAYAVLHVGVRAGDAIAYVRRRNLADRKYKGQQPPRGGAMHNSVFCDIVRSLQRESQPRGVRNRQRVSLHSGCSDRPGYSHLERISPFLWVGNKVAAAHGNFDIVVSTTTPYDAEGRAVPHLMTHKVLFEDAQGAETAADAEFANSCILQGVEFVAQSIASGRRTLVHCAWGQNGSCAICCAYAVIHTGMRADDAIAYVRERNLADRKYRGQRPPGGAMHNGVFCEIVRALEQGQPKTGMRPSAFLHA